jgi:hypothetical protein
MSTDADGTITFDTAGSHARSSASPRLSALVLADERTSLLGSDDGRTPIRSFTEELDPDSISRRGKDGAEGGRNGLGTWQRSHVGSAPSPSGWLNECSRDGQEEEHDFGSGSKDQAEVEVLCTGEHSCTSALLGFVHSHRRSLNGCRGTAGNCEFSLFLSTPDPHAKPRFSGDLVAGLSVSSS